MTKFTSPLDFIVERLKTYDEVQLCELLDITSEEILHRFRDRVEENLEYLESELEVIHITDDEYEEDDYDGFEIETLVNGRWVRQSELDEDGN